MIRQKNINSTKTKREEANDGKQTIDNKTQVKLDKRKLRSKT